MDIPRWLYEKTGEDGTWYDGEYGIIRLFEDGELVKKKVCKPKA